MTRRKGELSPAGIDRGWPHQVALPAAQVTGANYKLVHGFCAGLSFCERRHSVRRGEVGHVVFCFAELLGMAGVPVMRAAAMTAFTYRHAVVRHRRQSRNVPSCGSRRAIRSLNTRSSSRSTFGGNGTCRTIPRLRRLRVSMLATPLSMSMAGVSASTSEMRAPLHRSVRQKLTHQIYWVFGAPEEIRTPDPQIRSLVLYPAELRARRVVSYRLRRTMASRETRSMIPKSG